MTTDRSDRARLRAIAFPGDAGARPRSRYSEGGDRAGGRPQERAPATTEEPTRDLRALPWCSIDNDDSRDLDQPTSRRPRGGAVKAMVAIADVDAAVRKDPRWIGTPRRTPRRSIRRGDLSDAAQRLSTDLTSLNHHEDRLAVVMEFAVSREGEATRRRSLPRAGE